MAVIARPLGIRTNNYAEWTAVVLGLERAAELGASEVELVLDSKLVVEQISGRWRVKQPALIALHRQAQTALKKFSRWSARHEGRASNRAADALANLALDDPAAARRAEAATAGPGGAGLGVTGEAQAGLWSEAAVPVGPTGSTSSAGPGTRTPDPDPEAWICATCGMQYPLSLEPPADCPICEDDRQYVGWEGQRWTTMAQLVAAGHQNRFNDEEPGLVSIGTEPKFAIGQRALLVQTPAGNVLWDCITLLDAETVVRVRELGGIAAIAISHPHFYDAMTSWSAAFGDCPVYIHASDREWVQYAGTGLRLWDGDSLEILPGVTMINTGGHFPGSSVLHWAAGAAGRGALLTGDSITVVQDRRWVSFMYSFPNLIPLGDAEVRRIVEVLRPYRYERIYSLWEGRVTASDGPAAVERSAERYLAHR